MNIKKYFFVLLMIFVIFVSGCHKHEIEGIITENHNPNDGEKKIIESCNNGSAAEQIIYYASIDWEIGGIHDNGLENAIPTRIRSDFIETFKGAKIVIEPKYKDGIVFKLIGYDKDDSGSFIRSGYIEYGKYENDTETVITIPEHCYIRIQLYYVNEPEFTDVSGNELENMVRVIVSPTLSEYNRSLDSINADDFKIPRDFLIENKDLQNKDTIMFTWISDTHHQIHNGRLYGTSIETFREMANISQKLNVDFIVLTGDVVNGYYSVAEQKKDLINVTNSLISIDNIPIFYTQGNHDDNSWYVSANGSSATQPSGLKELLTSEEFTSYTMSNTIETAMFDDENPLGGYYYKDFRKSKIRIIVLNCEDIPYIENEDLSLKYYGQWTMGFRQQQLDWLANKALKINETGWGIIVFLHSDSNMLENNQNMVNLDAVNQLIDAQKNNESGMIINDTIDFALNISYDFSNSKPLEEIAWFSGHIHKDNYEIINGVPHVSIVNAFNEEGGGYDIVTVDRSKRKIYTKRFNKEPLEKYNREIYY